MQSAEWARMGLFIHLPHCRRCGSERSSHLRWRKKGVHSECPRAGIGLVRSAGFQTCRIADFQVGVAWNSTAGLMLTAIRRFGNPGYSRFGNLRYAFCTWKSRGPHLVDILRPSAHSQTACFLSRNVVGWSASPRVLLDE